MAIFAHEPYVLTPQQVIETHHEKLNFLAPLSNPHDLILFAVVGGAITFSLLVALWLKSTAFFKRIGATIDRASIVAPDVIRIAFGSALLASAAHTSLFGPEIPLTDIPYGQIIQILLWVCGGLVLVGFRTRLWAAIAVLIWLYAFFTKGIYLFTYSNYLGEATALLFMPQQLLSLDHLLSRGRHSSSVRLERSLGWGMPISRILFGFALLYTAITVKVLYPAEPLEVVTQYHLTNYFPFDPAFIVLGAGLTEILIALLYLAGLLQRLTTIIFLTFITLSLLFFKESVWPHYLLMGLGVGIFLHKPDRLSLDRRLFPSRSK